jgi:hypothetical protein
VRTAEERPQILIHPRPGGREHGRTCVEGRVDGGLASPEEQKVDAEGTLGCFPDGGDVLWNLLGRGERYAQRPQTAGVADSRHEGH